MRFLHTSDICYGATPDANKPWGRERAQAIADSLDKITRVCKRDNIDMLLIAGNLFNSIPTGMELNEANAAFASIPDTRVVIIPGRNDMIIPSSPAVNFVWAGNVTYVKDMKNGNFCDEDHAILMTVQDPGTIDSPEKYAYIALGGSRKPSPLMQGHMAYSGSPEPMSREDTSKHGYYIGEIDPERKELSSLKFITLPTVRYISLVVNVTPETTNAEVVDNIRNEITNRGQNNIYHLRLKGMCNPEVTFNLSSLQNNFRVSDVVDQTEPKYDYQRLMVEHSDDMVGFFIAEMNKGDKSELQQKALAYGINALLKTADERK